MLQSREAEDLIGNLLECRAMLAKSNADKQAITGQLDGMDKALSAAQEPQAETDISWWEFWH